METVLQGLFILCLILINGFFVASEFSLISVRRTRIQELIKKKNKAALLVLKALKNLDTFISATQLGVTLASLALGWIGEPFMAHILQPVFSFLPSNIAFITAHGLSVALAFLVITFIHIVLGELVPKTIALQYSEVSALRLVVPLTVFSVIFHPFILLLRTAGQLIIRTFGLYTPTRRQVYSEEEVKLILAQAGQGGSIPLDEVEMVYNVFRMGDILVRRIMVPPKKFIAFSVDTPFSEVKERAERYFYSRYPVYKGSVDTVVGFIHIKDIYKLVLGGYENQPLSRLNVIRKPLVVSELEKVDEVLLLMQKRRVHLAIVRDKKGMTCGIVTLEDVLESLVGEIEDEFDKRDLVKPLQKKG